MKNGRMKDAFTSMSRLRAHPIIAARDFYYSVVIYEEECKLSQNTTYFSRLWDCFSIPRIRRANYGASTVMIAQQMCGINSKPQNSFLPNPPPPPSPDFGELIPCLVISFYSSTIFTNVGYTATQALYASLGYGAIQVVFTIPTLFLIDTKGRRTLTLITFPIMCITLLAAGLSLLVPDTASKGAQIGPVVLFVYLFTIAYSLGEGPVAFQYSAEVFPTIQREQGMAWAVCINNTFGKFQISSSSSSSLQEPYISDIPPMTTKRKLTSPPSTAGILSLTFPRMTTVMTQTGAFGFYAALNLIAWFMIFAFVRETKQLTLEEIDQVFSVPTKEFLAYETKTWLPYFVKRHILRRRIEKPPPIIEKADRFSDEEERVAAGQDVRNQLSYAPAGGI